MMYPGRRSVSLALPLAIFMITTLASCGAYRADYTPADPYWKDNDTRNIPEPGERDPMLIWQTIERTSFKQADQLLDLDRSFRKVCGRPGQAWNINSFDEVPDCAWFTNRHHRKRLSAEQLRRGRTVTGGPDTSDVWTVFRPKVGGVTAGFWIRDARGKAYMIKFDPPDNPELATAAAAITGRFLYACGYTVPEETITHFRPDRLRIGEGVTYKDRNDTKRPFTRKELNKILSKAHREPDGSYRCLASLALPNIKGPFSFDGRRRDDPNDWCDHEHRRELRALYVLCSFVNHWDIKDENTMDIYTEEDGRQFLRHCLLDFGSTLGSAGHGPQLATSGYCNSFDLLDALVSLVTFGFKRWQWEKAQPYEYSSVGYFESEIFHPAKWDPIYPIPAFENMTNRDAYWGAKIVMSFRDDDLEALVDAGRLSDPEARAYLLRTLIKRRDKIGRYWFNKVNALDNFSINQSANGLLIKFDDLAVKYDLANSSRSEFTVEYKGHKLIAKRETSSASLLLSPVDLDVMTAAYRPENKPDDNLFGIRIKTCRDDDHWSKPVLLWLWYHVDQSRFQLVGIEHLD